MKNKVISTLLLCVFVVLSFKNTSYAFDSNIFKSNSFYLDSIFRSGIERSFEKEKNINYVLKINDDKEEEVIEEIVEDVPVVITEEVVEEAPITTVEPSKINYFQNSVWDGLSFEQKQEAILKLVQYISNELEISVPNVEYEPQGENVAARYSSSRKTIVINSNLTFTGDRMLFFISHEMRHHFQYEHKEDDSDFGRAVKYNDEHYISLNDDYDGYLNQFIEADAIDYSNAFYWNYNMGCNLYL